MLVFVATAKAACVERLVLLALGHTRKQAAVVLGRVGRILLGDNLPALPVLKRGLGGGGLGLGLGEHDPDVARLGLAELRLVAVVVRLDRGRGDLRGVLGGQLLVELADTEAEQQIVER